MQVAYVVQDDKGNVGQSIPFTQGETRLVTLWLFLANGLPFVIPGTISTAVLKIFSGVNQASIQKTLAGATVTLTAVSGSKAGTIGFQFPLTAADTASMAANNSGLPMIATLTDSGGLVYEFDFVSLFNVGVPAVIT